MEHFLFLILTVHKLLINCKTLKLEIAKMMFSSKEQKNFWIKDTIIRLFKDDIVSLIILILVNILIL